MLRDQIIAAIRTGSAVWGPAIITAIATALTSWGFDLEVDSSWGIALAGFLFAVLVAGYNLAVNLLTTHVWQGFGWLLGVNKLPDYAQAPGLPPINEGVEDLPDAPYNIN